MNVADKDQMKAGFKDFAEAAFNYYTILIETGFKPEQAILLTVGFQNTTIQNNN
jgi:hypothetical protein